MNTNFGTVLIGAMMIRLLRKNFAAPVWLLAVMLSLAACAPDVKERERREAEAPEEVAEEEVERPTTATIEWRAEAPSEGFQLPFEDALPARDIETGKRGGNFTYATFGEPKTFDPITANESSSADVLGRMFDGLIEFDPYKQAYYPRLLKELYMEGEDKLTWILRLRSGLKWSDGQPITADDIIFSTQVVYDPDIISPAKDILQVEGQPVQFEKVDDLTVRATVAQPTGIFHVMLSSLVVMPKHTLEEAYKAGQYESALNVNVDPASIVCSGPFKLRQYAQGERVILERNPQYYKYDKNGTQLPYLDTFTFSITPDTEAMLVKFQAGGADGVNVVRPQSVPDMRDGQKEGNYTLHEPGPGDGASVFWFNLKEGNNPETGKPYVDPFRQKLFANEDFRKAVYHGLNKDGIIRSLLLGLAVNIYTMESPALKFWYNPDTAKYPYDPEKAAQLLEQIGFTDRDGDGIREDADGNRLSFTFITNRGNKSREDAATLIAADLKRVGIDAVPQLLEFNTLVTAINSRYEYEACYLGFGGGIHPASSMNLWRSSGRTHFFNPLQEKPATPWEAEVDRLCDAFIRELDPMKQREIYFRMQAIFAEHCAFLPLWVSKVHMASRNGFGNIKPTALASIFWNADEIYVK